MTGSVVGGALLSVRQGANTALSLWMTTVAAAERNAENQVSTEQDEQEKEQEKVSATVLKMIKS